MIHWNETCAEKIFTLEKTITRMKMEHIVTTERLIGEVACLQNKINEFIKREGDKEIRGAT